MTRLTGLKLECLCGARSPLRAQAIMRHGRTSLHALRPSSLAARRGLSLLELLLAITISAMVAGAIAGMLGAVSAGVGTRKDSREIMVLAHSAQCRLSAYLATARCVLADDSANLTLWLNDDRESGTVHASEIRWLRFDTSTGEIVVDYVSFPVSWTPTACELADREYPASTDWSSVHSAYDALGLLESKPLVDHLTGVSIQRDTKSVTSSRHICFNLSFQGDNATVTVPVSGTIQEHEAPAK